jgi:predicted nucleic acid-binding protein
MKKIFIDTNVIIDVYTERADFHFDSACILSLIDKKIYNGFVSALTYPNIYYILRKLIGKTKAIEILEKTKVLCKTVTLDIKCIELAMVSEFNDLEDAIQYYSAVSTGCECIITRNPKDYKVSELPVYTPKEFLALKKT